LLICREETSKFAEFAKIKTRISCQLGFKGCHC